MTRPKTLKAAKRRAWQAISRYVRRVNATDGMVNCVTCDKNMHWKEAHCGHFIHGLTYAEDVNGKFYALTENYHAQCNSCNTWLNGKLDVYTLYMLDMYGREMIEELQSLRHKPLKMKIDDFWDIEQEFIALFDELECEDQ